MSMKIVMSLIQLVWILFVFKMLLTHLLISSVNALSNARIHICFLQVQFD